MMNHNLQAIYVKCRRVVRSCKTVGQLYVAAKYVSLAARLPGFDAVEHDAMRQQLTARIKFVRHYGSQTKTRNTDADNTTSDRKD